MAGTSKAYLLRDISTYTDDELVKLVDGIRERRLRVVTAYKKAKVASQQVEREKLETKHEKKLKQFETKIEKVNVGITELENRLAELLAIRLELGDDIRNG